jgi:hypothetical protein
METKTCKNRKVFRRRNFVLKEDDVYTQSTTPRRMNGFEALIDVVERRHLGKLQRYFLNVVSTNRHYNPYDLITVPEYRV